MKTITLNVQEYILLQKFYVESGFRSATLFDRLEELEQEYPNDDVPQGTIISIDIPEEDIEEFLEDLDEASVFFDDDESCVLIKKLKEEVK